MNGEHLIETVFLDRSLLDRITSPSTPPVLRNQSMDVFMAGNEEGRPTFQPLG